MTSIFSDGILYVHINISCLLFGIIIARKGLSAASAYALREVWLYEHKMIVVLNDVDIEQMLIEKRNGNNPAKLLIKKIEDFRLLI